MKTIIDTEITEFLNSPNDLIEGKDLFKNCKFSDPDIQTNDSSIRINSIVEQNPANLFILESTIKEFSCECDSYKFNKKICKHIVCLLNVYNESIKHDLDIYKDINEIIFNVKPIIVLDEKKDKTIRITVDFGTNNYQNIAVTNISNLFKYEDKFTFFANYGIRKEQVDEQSLNIIYEFKDILEKTNSMAASSFIDISYEHMDIWMEFFKKFGISFHLNAEGIWFITHYNYGQEKYDWEVSNSVKPFVNNKKKFSLKNVKDNDYVALYSKTHSYLLMINKSRNEINVFEYEFSKEVNIKNFVEQIGKTVNKNQFYSLYLAIRALFWNYEKIISSTYVMQQKLNKIDPVLEVKVFLHDELQILCAKLTFLYGDMSYPYKENETNYLKRERFLEKKIIDEIIPFFPDYNKEFDVFEIIEHQKWMDFKDWANKKANDEYYQFKAAEGLLFKIKKRKRFSIQGAKFDNEFLKVSWQLEGFSEEDMKKIISSYVKKIKYVKLSNNKEINISSEIDMEQLLEELKALNISVEDLMEDNTSNVSLYNASYFSSLYEDKLDDETKNKIKSIFDDSDVKNELPDNLKNLLKDYQIKGYSWWKKLMSLNAGGILADEMGLGKTMQSISVLADIYYNKKTNLPSIIICPSSLVYNWKNEISKFTPFIKFAVMDGSQQERHEILNNIDKYNIIITSLTLLSKDLDKYLEYEFFIQLIDEAQRIKSHSAQSTKNVKKINAKHKFALTGTPIENNLSELWSIFDYLMPGYLYDYKSFKQIYEDKIVDKDPLAAKKLKMRINPFVLRRTKKEVLKELPEKITKILTSELNEEQKELYLTELHRSKSEIQLNLKDKKEKNTQVFEILLKLRQICCSPKLIYENAKSNGEKFKNCIDLVLQAIKNGSKILIFSQFVKMINILSEELSNRKIPHLSLTGSIPNQERLQLVDDFNNKEHYKVFLISLRAGGVGLTLTSADTVIHYDPWWNGSLEDQATDRAHRIGQKKNVSIYKLISKDSIEEKVLKLQETKKEMFNMMFDENGFLDGETGASNKLTMDQLYEILDIEKIDK